MYLFKDACIFVCDMFTEYMFTCIHFCVCEGETETEKEIIYLSKFQNQKLIAHREQSREKLVLWSQQGV